MRNMISIGGLIAALATVIWSPTAQAAEMPQRSDVPMSRPEEAIAVIDGIGAKAAMLELPGGDILMARGGGRFIVRYLKTRYPLGPARSLEPIH